MLSHLDRALDLHASTTGRSPRQQTLRGTIAWSCDLLDPAAQRLFRCCAVFPGGASLEAVDAVWTAIEQNEEEAVDDVLQRLLDASMVTVAEADDGSSRIEILNTVREYAEERLCASSDDAVVRRAALHFFRGLMWAGIHDQSPGAWTALSGRLIVELDNFRAGLRWLLLPSRSPDADDVSEACLITWGLTNWLLWQRSFRQEGIFWCEQALAASGQAQTVEVAACRAALGRLLTLEGKVEAAQTAVLSAAERLATLTSRTGLRPEDVNLIEWLAQGTRASVAGHLGHLDQGERLLRELTTVAAHPRLRAWNLIRLGHIRRGQGDFDEALELDTEAYELALREAEETLVSMAGAALAYDLKFMGRLEEADALMRSLIPRMLTSAGREDLLIELAEDFGAILAERGRATGAAVLWGAAWAERNRRSLSLHPEQEQQLSHSLALARTALGATWDEWLQRGRELELAQALRQALDDGAGTDT
jgi:tetratricopeptide (TPR) repeat protein